MALLRASSRWTTRERVRKNDEGVDSQKELNALPALRELHDEIGMEMEWRGLERMEDGQWET